MFGKSTAIWAIAPFRVFAATALLAILAIASPAFAEGADRSSFPPEITDLVKQNDAEKMFSKSARSQFVLSINKYCNHIDFIFPRNTPDDEKWLNEEINGSFERRLKAIDSVQYFKDKIKWFVFECKNNSENFDKKTKQEKLGKLIGLINAFSKIDSSDSIRISQLLKIDNYESGLFMSNEIMKTIIIAASAENNDCDTVAPWCLTNEK